MRVLIGKIIHNFINDGFCVALFEKTEDYLGDAFEMVD